MNKPATATEAERLRGIVLSAVDELLQMPIVRLTDKRAAANRVRGAYEANGASAVKNGLCDTIDYVYMRKRKDCREPGE